MDSPSMESIRSPNAGSRSREWRVSSHKAPLKVYRTFHTDTPRKAGTTFQAEGFVSTTFNDSYGNGDGDPARRGRTDHRKR